MRERSLNTEDGLKLHVVDWPAPAAAALGRGLLIMHGIGEHGGRYAHVARFFNALGFDVRTYDHRGHGRSEGPRGDVPDGMAMLRDAQHVMEDFSRGYAVAPHLLGHSMGGVFAARFATGRLAPLSGLILSSPALAFPLSAAQKMLLAIMHTLAPGVPVNNGLKTRYISHDSKVVQAYERDPLVHPKVSARLLRAMLDAQDFAHAHAAQLELPVLLVVAGDDHLVDAAGSERFAQALPAGRGTLKRYPGLYHEIFNETDPTPVFADIRSWLAQQGCLNTTQAVNV